MRDVATQTKPSLRRKATRSPATVVALSVSPATIGVHHCAALSLGLSAFPNVTRVTAVLAHSLGELLLLGTEGGHVFIVEVPGFRELEERNISLDQVANRFAMHHTSLHEEG